MWQEKLQDAVTSHPWLEPHQDIKRKPQAPGMQLVDWYGFTVPKTEKKMFLKQSARREDLLVVGEVNNIHSFFDDYETEWKSNILFDDLDEALCYCEDVRSGFISDIQLHSSFIMYKVPGFKAMPGGGFLSSSTVTAMEPVPMTMSNSIRSAQRLAMHPSSTVEQSIQITCASNIRMMNMEHFAGAISTRRHTVISNTPHVSSTSATADFEKGSARMPAQPKTSLKAKSSISTTATSSRMRTDRIRRKSPQKGFGMNSEMSA